VLSRPKESVVFIVSGLGWDCSKLDFLLNYLFRWKRISIFLSTFGKGGAKSTSYEPKVLLHFFKSGGTKNLFLDFD
jgi:hypothetical protein